MTIFGREPAFWIGVIVSLVAAVLGVLTGNGLITDVAAGEVTDLVTATAQLAVLLAPIIGALIIRTQVTPSAAPAVDQGTTVTVITPGDAPNTTMIAR